MKIWGHKVRVPGGVMTGQKRKKAIERYRANKKFNQETLDMLLALYK